MGLRFQCCGCRGASKKLELNDQEIYERNVDFSMNKAFPAEMLFTFVNCLVRFRCGSERGQREYRLTLKKQVYQIHLVSYPILAP